MHKPIALFLTTLILFATGTSAIGFSLASESYRTIRPKTNSYKVVPTKNIPWYCVANVGKITGQFAENPASAGYYPSAGYQIAPGYSTQPGYSAQPGYQMLAEPVRPLIAATQSAKLKTDHFKQAWQNSLTACPKGYSFDENLVTGKCATALQKKLEGNPLPAESKEQYETCAKILMANVWNSKITQKICSAFYLYETDCTSSQKNKRACTPLSRYLGGAGVSQADIPKIQSDTIYLCKDVFPKP